MREDLKLKDEARAKGWKATLNVRDRDAKKKIDYKDLADCPSFSLVFERDDTSLWYCGRSGWAGAELNNKGMYVNHRYYDTLEIALNKEG